MKTLLLVGVVIAAIQFTAYPQEEKRNAIEQAEPATSPADQTEIAAWEIAEKNGTPTAFMRFYQKYPLSSYIKTYFQCC